MSVLSASHKIMFLLIFLVFITVSIMFMWKTVPQRCYTEINGTYTRVITNTQKCADICWRKHDYGSDLDNDDCFVLNIYSESGDVKKEDIENDYIKCYFDMIEQGKSYKLKVRYDASVPEISLRII